MESRAVPKASKELDSAIEDDRKYKEVDSAKKRAVAQRVDYDTFKNLVSVAHLKPLQAPDEIVRVKGAPAWRFNALGLSEDKESGQKVASASGADDGGFVPTEQPKTSADFERTWKKMCRTNRDKYDYVKFCSPETLSKIFKVELSSTLLSSILEVLQDCFVATSEGDADIIFRSLRCLAKSGRFSLTGRLLGSKHKACLRDVVGQLKEALGEDAAEMQELLKDYGLNPS